MFFVVGDPLDSRGNFANVYSAGLNAGRKQGANWSAVRGASSYLIDSKKCFGIIRAALSLLKSVYDFPHNPKVAGSNPAPATNESHSISMA
jgi:hypothetical protein